MKPLIRIFIVLIAALSLAAPAVFAEKPEFTEIPSLFGTFIPKKGAWSEYEVFEKQSGKKLTMKMSVVDVEGSDYWYEVINREGDSVNIIKMLIKGNPNNSENIKRLIMKSGDQNPREMPIDFVKMGRRMAKHMFTTRTGVPEDTSSISVKELGMKEIEVPAGKFKGEEKQIVKDSGEVLATFIFDEKILPFGIIVSDSKDAMMKLLGYGMDAETMITGTIDHMEMPPGMPEMPRGMPPGMGDGMMMQKQ